MNFNQFFEAFARLLRPSNARSYRDIVPTYGEYAALQKGRYQSFESENARWREGQRRFIEKNFSSAPKSAKILDIACGDGVGLHVFREMHFTDVTGVEFNPKKADRARLSGYPVQSVDMHDLSCFPDQAFDVVYSSHTIEHAYHPKRMIEELVRVLKESGELIVVLPYPDETTKNDLAHGAKYELGTNIDDGGRTVISVFESLGLRLKTLAFDKFREPEIWLTFARAHND